MRTMLNYKFKDYARKIYPNLIFLTKLRQKIILNKIIKDVKTKKRKIRVCFFVVSCDKWNSDSLFKLMKQSDHFEPFIVLTVKDVGCFKNKNEIDFHYSFYKEKYPDDIFLAYNLENDTYVDLKNYNPDIIFYQEGWYLNKKQAPRNICKFALPAYFPYPVAEPVTILNWRKRNLHFLLWKHYIAHKMLKKEYSKNLKPKLPNLKVTGHPKLDVYLEDFKKNEKNYVIYAPHHSLPNSMLNWSTFDWSGKFMLKYAKMHPEFNWIYRPHPHLAHTVVEKGIMNEKEYNDYIEEWKKIGLYYMSGDYFDLFRNSKCLITCCGSFLIEYFPTLKPVIHLRTENTLSTSSLNHAVMETYYKAYNEEELKKHLSEIIENNNDSMLSKREQTLKELGLLNNSAADNIMTDLMREFRIK